LNAHTIYPQKSVEISGKGGHIALLPILQEHGSISTFGFRIADFLYSCDVSDFPEESHAGLAGLETWVIDALRPTPHPSHLSLPETLGWIERMHPKRAVLTNLHVDMDFQQISSQTPKYVEMAYDGMVLKVL
jgi:phosphoribosyl 1,2-cyclic phosphate phosphodiesterase